MNKLTSAKSGKPPEGLSARRAAVSLLVEVIKKRMPFERSFAHHALEGQLRDLSSQDRAFARAIATTALRRHGEIEDVLSHFVTRPLPRRSGSAKEILVCATAQILFMGSPAHAVINVAVELAHNDRSARHFAKLINAVLRKVADKGPDIAAQDDRALLNIPPWLKQHWTDAYGTDALQKIAAVQAVEPALDIVVKSSPGEWAGRLDGAPLLHNTLRRSKRGRIENIDGFESGEWWIQDVAAALPATLLGDIKGLDIADLCAAPGGKTAQLASAGAKVTAIDVSAPRLARLEENLTRLKLQAKIVHKDIMNWQPPQAFDAILLDAPCSATGTIRRHPDIAILKSQKDVIELAHVQKALLDKAISHLKPGGTMIYCACSLQSEESENQIGKLLEGNAQIRLDPILPREIDGNRHWLNRQGMLRTLPHYLEPPSGCPAGMDGFFAARLIKK